MMLVSALTLSYYAPIVAWSIFYLVMSIISLKDGELPWMECNQDLAKSDQCVTTEDMKLESLSGVEDFGSRRIFAAEQYFQYVLWQYFEKLIIPTNISYSFTLFQVLCL
jgi:hypothetical protein